MCIIYNTGQAAVTRHKGSGPRFRQTLEKEGLVLSTRRDRPVPAATTAGSRSASDALFDRFVGDDDYFSPVWAGLPVALWEDHDHIYLEADLPGVNEEDVDVSVEDSKLFIRGERNPEECRGYLFDGRSYGRFERVISLPEPVDSGQVEVWLNRGVLSIALCKRLDATIAGERRGARRGETLSPA
jgi:HSP20 family protein